MIPADDEDTGQWKALLMCEGRMFVTDPVFKTYADGYAKTKLACEIINKRIPNPHMTFRVIPI